MARVVVFIEGGVIVNSVTDSDGIELMIVDYDSESDLSVDERAEQRYFVEVELDNSLVEQAIVGTELEE